MAFNPAEFLDVFTYDKFQQQLSSFASMQGARAYVATLDVDDLADLGLPRTTGVLHELQARALMAAVGGVHIQSGLRTRAFDQFAALRTYVNAMRASEAGTAPEMREFHPFAQARTSRNLDSIDGMVQWMTGVDAEARDVPFILERLMQMSGESIARLSQHKVLPNDPSARLAFLTELAEITASTPMAGVLRIQVRDLIGRWDAERQLAPLREGAQTLRWQELLREESEAKEAIGDRGLRGQLRDEELLPSKMKRQTLERLRASEQFAFEAAMRDGALQRKIQATAQLSRAAFRGVFQTVEDRGLAFMLQEGGDHFNMTEAELADTDLGRGVRIAIARSAQKARRTFARTQVRPAQGALLGAGREGGDEPLEEEQAADVRADAEEDAPGIGAPPGVGVAGDQAAPDVKDEHDGADPADEADRDVEEEEEDAPGPVALGLEAKEEEKKAEPEGPAAPPGPDAIVAALRQQWQDLFDPKMTNGELRRLVNIQTRDEGRAGRVSRDSEELDAMMHRRGLNDRDTVGAELWEEVGDRLAQRVQRSAHFQDAQNEQGRRLVEMIGELPPPARRLMEQYGTMMWHRVGTNPRIAQVLSDALRTFAENAPNGRWNERSKRLDISVPGQARQIVRIPGLGRDIVPWMMGAPPFDTGDRGMRNAIHSPVMRGIFSRALRMFHGKWIQQINVSPSYTGPTVQSIVGQFMHDSNDPSTTLQNMQRLAAEGRGGMTLVAMNVDALTAIVDQWEDLVEQACFVPNDAIRLSDAFFTEGSLGGIQDEFKARAQSVLDFYFKYMGTLDVSVRKRLMRLNMSRAIVSAQTLLSHARTTRAHLSNLELERDLDENIQRLADGAINPTRFWQYLQALRGDQPPQGATANPSPDRQSAAFVEEAESETPESEVSPAAPLAGKGAPRSRILLDQSGVTSEPSTPGAGSGRGAQVFPHGNLDALDAGLSISPPAFAGDQSDVVVLPDRAPSFASSTATAERDALLGRFAQVAGLMFPNREQTVAAARAFYGDEDLQEAMDTEIGLAAATFPLLLELRSRDRDVRLKAWVELVDAQSREQNVDWPDVDRKIMPSDLAFMGIMSSVPPPDAGGEPVRSWVEDQRRERSAGAPRAPTETPEPVPEGSEPSGFLDFTRLSGVSGVSRVSSRGGRRTPGGRRLASPIAGLGDISGISRFQLDEDEARDFLGAMQERVNSLTTPRKGGRRKLKASPGQLDVTVSSQATTQASQATTQASEEKEEEKKEEEEEKAPRPVPSMGDRRMPNAMTKVPTAEDIARWAEMGADHRALIMFTFLRATGQTFGDVMEQAGFLPEHDLPMAMGVIDLLLGMDNQRARQAYGVWVARQLASVIPAGGAPPTRRQLEIRMEAMRRRIRARGTVEHGRLPEMIRRMGSPPAVSMEELKTFSLRGLTGDTRALLGIGEIFAGDGRVVGSLKASDAPRLRNPEPQVVGDLNQQQRQLLLMNVNMALGATAPEGPPAVDLEANRRRADARLKARLSNLRSESVPPPGGRPVFALFPGRGGGRASAQPPGRVEAANPRAIAQMAAMARRRGAPAPPPPPGAAAPAPPPAAGPGPPAAPAVALGIAVGAGAGPPPGPPPVPLPAVVIPAYALMIAAGGGPLNLIIMSANGGPLQQRGSFMHSVITRDLRTREEKSRKPGILRPRSHHPKNRKNARSAWRSDPHATEGTLHHHAEGVVEFAPLTMQDIQKFRKWATGRDGSLFHIHMKVGRLIRASLDTMKVFRRYLWVPRNAHLPKTRKGRMLRVARHRAHHHARKKSGGGFFGGSHAHDHHTPQMWIRDQRHRHTERSNNDGTTSRCLCPTQIMHANVMRDNDFMCPRDLCGSSHRIQPHKWGGDHQPVAVHSRLLPHHDGVSVGGGFMRAAVRMPFMQHLKDTGQFPNEKVGAGFLDDAVGAVASGAKSVGKAVASGAKTVVKAHVDAVGALVHTGEQAVTATGHYLAKAGEQFLENTKQWGKTELQIWHDMGKGLKAGWDDFDDFFKDPTLNNLWHTARGVGKMGLALGEARIRSMGETINYITETPFLSELNQIATFAVPGLSNVEATWQILNDASHNEWDDALVTGAVRVGFLGAKGVGKFAARESGLAEKVSGALPDGLAREAESFFNPSRLGNIGF